MKIGSFLPIVNAPGRQPNAPTTNPDQSSRSEASPAAVKPSSASPESYADFIASAEQNSRAQQTRFFNMDRDLSFRGQEALSVYLTTEDFRAAPSAELVGVDIYV